MYAERAFRAGAAGYVSKQEMGETVLTPPPAGARWGEVPESEDSKQKERSVKWTQ